MNRKIAILHQAAQPPEKDGIIKPMKAGGYSDSSADIAYSLRKEGIQIVTPVDLPTMSEDLDWSFPDTTEGINEAITKGANIIWLNTVLYSGHPIENFANINLNIVGQIPAAVDVFDDKIKTNQLLKSFGLPVPDNIVIHKDSSKNSKNFDFPVVVKPIRGRGSQGVAVVNDSEDLEKYFKAFFSSNKYGSSLYIESFLSGEELTITVMPPGDYQIDGKNQYHSSFWSLPPVRRFNHKDGIAPYNGIVSVINNSEVLGDSELAKHSVNELMRYCEKAAEIVNAKAPIRIDCRADSTGKYFLFDLNMKPNMTGASRPGREDQDSLTALAARKIGWTYDELLLNILNQSWNISDIKKFKNL